MGELNLKEIGCWVRRSELSVREKPVCHSFRLHSLSFIEIRTKVCMNLSVQVKRTQTCVGILSMLSVSEVWKNKLYLSFTQINEYYVPVLELSWVLCPRCTQTHWVLWNLCTQLKYLSTHRNQVGSWKPTRRSVPRTYVVTGTEGSLSLTPVWGPSRVSVHQSPLWLEFLPLQFI